MDITINTPALLFPAISLVMLAYTNRYLGLATVVRSLHDRYTTTSENREVIHSQIKYLKYRLRLIKNMQGFGVFSFILCILCMYCIYANQMLWAHILFAGAVISFTVSLLISLVEIGKSTKALELELSDMEGLEDPTLVQYIKSKFDRE